MSSDGFRLALGTLTVLPAPMPSKVDRVVGGRAMVLAPLVGLLIGAISAAVVAVVHLVKPEAPLLAAVLGVLALVVLSGALHLDGLADFADALGSRRDRETMLRIMKQSDIGPFGVVAIVAVLLLDIAALTACVQSDFGWQAVLIATTASRLSLTWSCRTTIPSARPDGLGAVVASTVRPVTAALTSFTVLVGALAFTWLTMPASWLLGGNSPTAIRFLPYTDSSAVQAADPVVAAPPIHLLAGAAVAVLAAVAVSVLVTRRARSTIGGITGDVLGATVELTLPAALLALTLAT
jgi:adenosylcobinamide-GDP ribazoletransferase